MFLKTIAAVLATFLSTAALATTLECEGTNDGVLGNGEYSSQVRMYVLLGSSSPWQDTIAMRKESDTYWTVFAKDKKRTNVSGGVKYTTEEYILKDLLQISGKKTTIASNGNTFTTMMKIDRYNLSLKVISEGRDGNMSFRSRIVAQCRVTTPKL